MADKTTQNTALTHEDRIVAHILNTGPKFKLAMVLLGCVSAWALFAYIWQVSHGLGVTGMFRPVYWGFYIISFVFFIGVSHAGTLISAILRLTKAEWRRSITRMAEVITVLVISFGAGNVIVDMGRPDRVLNVLFHPNFRSPLLWDVCSITVYLTSSTIYLFLPLLPDIYRLNKRIGGWRGYIYRALLFGYTDSPAQRHKLEKAMGVLMILVVPVAISVHTVVSWVFAMTIQPMWHSTIFGPYFVVGAIFSGIAGIFSFLVVLRKLFHLEDYLRPVHLDFLGRLLLAFTLLWLYFTTAEYITAFYGNEPVEMAVFRAKFFGAYAPHFWTMVFCCFVLPFSILARRSTRTNPVMLFIVSISINIGMFLERFIIVVPTLTNPRLLMTHATYSPSWVEWSILAGCTSAFVLLYLAFTKVFPIIAIWEIEEGIEQGAEEGRKRVESYYPAPDGGPA